ncbi:MAG: YfiR family protein [Sideroxyarcus sp.]|nr:YfiR family protein [Sideroxyarcus sp.]
MRYFLLLFLLTAPGAQASRTEFSAQQVKSAYVFNFIKFVEWPAQEIRAGDKVRLCVIGDDGLHASLIALDGRKVGEYELQVRRSTDPVNLSICHVLFIGAQERRRLVPIIKSLDSAHVLTVSDIPGFAERGGGIGLLHHDDRMLFEVNLASTKKAGLRLSGQMLNLAANIFGR